MMSIENTKKMAEKNAEENLNYICKIFKFIEDENEKLKNDNEKLKNDNEKLKNENEKFKNKFKKLKNKNKLKSLDILPLQIKDNGIVYKVYRCIILDYGKYKNNNKSDYIILGLKDKSYNKDIDLEEFNREHKVLYKIKSMEHREQQFPCRTGIGKNSLYLNQKKKKYESYKDYNIIMYSFSTNIEDNNTFIKNNEIGSDITLYIVADN